MKLSDFMNVHVFPESGIHETLCVTDEHYEKNIEIKSSDWDCLKDDIINSEILGWQTTETNQGTVILVSIKSLRG